MGHAERRHSLHTCVGARLYPHVLGRRVQRGDHGWGLTLKTYERARRAHAEIRAMWTRCGSSRRLHVLRSRPTRGPRQCGRSGTGGGCPPDTAQAAPVTCTMRVIAAVRLGKPIRTTRRCVAGPGDIHSRQCRPVEAPGPSTRVWGLGVSPLPAAPKLVVPRRAERASGSGTRLRQAARSQTALLS